jgi:hypothetical protein
VPHDFKKKVNIKYYNVRAHTVIQKKKFVPTSIDATYRKKAVFKYEFNYIIFTWYNIKNIKNMNMVLSALEIRFHNICLFFV